MSLIAALAWVAAALVALAGARKISRPAATGAALQAARLPSDARLVRLLGAGEVAVGAAVLLAGGRVPAIVLAVAYAAFTAFAVRQRRDGSDCGCFGQTGTPVTALHVACNVALCAAAVAAAVWPPASALALVGAEPVAGVAAAGLVAVGAALLQLLLTAVPELAAAMALVDPEASP